MFTGLENFKILLDRQARGSIRKMSRIYGIEHEEEVVNKFCNENDYSYEKSSDYEDKVQKFDYKIYDNEKDIVSRLSIKCTDIYDNVSYPKRDLNKDNESTHVLFENCFGDQYIIETKHLHALIRQMDKDDIFERYSGVEIIEYDYFYVIPIESLKEFPDVKLKKI